MALIQKRQKLNLRSGILVNVALQSPKVVVPMQRDEVVWALRFEDAGAVCYELLRPVESRGGTGHGRESQLDPELL